MQPSQANVKTFWLIVFSLTIVTASAQEKKKITPEIAYKFPSMELTKPLPDIKGWEDNSSYRESMKKERGEKAQVVVVDALSGKVKGESKSEVNWDDVKSLVDTTIDATKPVQSSTDNTKHLYSKDNDLYLLDISRKVFKRLTNNSSEEQNPTFSPDGNMIAFTSDGNLYSIDLRTVKETQYTTDGGDVVYNGWAAWLYYEEIFGRPTRYKAYWWSPDGKYIAFYHFDESLVPMYPLYNSVGQHGTLEKTRYPEPGDPNPMVKFAVADVASGKIAWADFNEKDDQYFGTPFWTPEGKAVWIQWMNRLQNNLKVYSVDPQSGKKKEVYDEKQTSWVDWLDDIHFLRDGNGFLINTDKDGWMHFYLYDMDGTLKNRVTQGKWQIVKEQYLDEKDGILYFTAKKEASTRTDLYKVNLDGTGMKRLTFGDYTHSVNMSPDGSYFITTYSNVKTPSKMALCNNGGEVVRELGNSWQKELDEYELAQTDLVFIPTADGYKLPARITLPPHLEPNKKYPVLISIYGGPNAGTVADGWRLSMQTEGLATDGLIQVSVDHRGSGHFGKEGTALMYHNLGKWEMNDYIEAVKWLRSQPYVNPNKICITGGSYGGYVTCMALTYGADYFQYGIANSSVTDWQLYDTHYTERFMGTPEQNPEGYKFGSVMTHLNNYKGLLRIVHGSTDDNVHYQNSLQLIDTLENLGKHFEFMTYPNQRHGIRPPKSDHARREYMRFYYEYLLEKEFPEQAFVRRPRSQS